MNDRSLTVLLAELDAELADKTDPFPTAAEILTVVEERVPGAVQRRAATLQLASLGCAVAMSGCRRG